MVNCTGFIIEFDPFNDLSFYYWITVTALGLLGWIARMLKERAGQSWPTVSGTVESAELIPNDNNYRAEVRYSYSAENEYYSGLFIRLAQTEKKGREDTRTISQGGTAPRPLQACCR